MSRAARPLAEVLILVATLAACDASKVDSDSSSDADAPTTVSSAPGAPEDLPVHEQFPVPEPHKEATLPPPTIHESRPELGVYGEPVDQAPRRQAHWLVYRDTRGNLLREVEVSPGGFRLTTDWYRHPDGSVHQVVTRSDDGNVERQEVRDEDGDLRLLQTWRASRLVSRETRDEDGAPIRREVHDFTALREEIDYGEGQARSLKRYDTRGRPHGWWETHDEDGRLVLQEEYEHGEKVRYWEYEYRGGQVISELWVLDILGREFTREQAFVTGE